MSLSSSVVPISGSTGSSTKAPMRSRLRSCRRHIPIQSARPPMLWPIPCIVRPWKGRLHMNVIASDSYPSSEGMAARGGEKVELDDLLRRSDFVSISCPLNKDNRGMIGAREFALMQPHAFFITTARGFIHDEAALEDALRHKRIAGAGLDVWAKEPPPPHHPLLQFDNVLASPHTAGVTKEARMNMGKIAAEQILDGLDGKRAPRLG